MPVPVIQTATGRWLLIQPEAVESGRVVAYCRVSSADQKDDLERQTGRVVSGATVAWRWRRWCPRSGRA
jgi:putative resolvase